VGAVSFFQRAEGPERPDIPVSAGKIMKNQCVDWSAAGSRPRCEHDAPRRDSRRAACRAEKTFAVQRKIFA
jgi:hypothetical protein